MKQLRVRVLPDRTVLPRLRDGADFGVPQLLLATHVESGRRLIWWPGHTSWSSRGESSWYPGELLVDSPNDRTFPHTRLETERQSLARLLKSERAREFIRKNFNDESAVIEAIAADATIEVR